MMASVHCMDLFIFYVLPASVHRTAMNEFKSTTNLKPRLSCQSEFNTQLYRWVTLLRMHWPYDASVSTYESNDETRLM